MLRRPRAFLVAVLAVSTASACYRPIVSQEGVRPGVLEALLAQAEDARGIRSDGRVDVRVVDARDLPPVVVRTMHMQWTEEELRRYQESLVTMGLWPPDVNLAERMASTLGREAVGLYIPEQRALYVVRDPVIPWRVRVVSALARRDLAREYALAHELVHFLQHNAYPGLFAAVLTIKDSDDTAWAVQAAIEGDAVRYGFAALGSSVPLPTAADFQAEMEKATAHGSFAHQPPLLRETVVFPYVAGYRLSSLEASLLLDRPPASTEQAMHLDRRDDAFTALRFPSAEVEGCEILWSNSIGELGMSVLLRSFDAGVSPRAWEGWDGDRYVVLQCGEIREFVWLTTWDSENDAREFAEAYAGAARRIAEHAELPDVPVVDVRGRDATAYTPRTAVVALRVSVEAERRRVRSLADVLGHELLKAGPRPPGDGR